MNVFLKFFKINSSKKIKNKKMVYQRYKVDEKLRVCKLIEKGYSTYWIERNLGIPDATTCR